MCHTILMYYRASFVGVANICDQSQCSNCWSLPGYGVSFTSHKTTLPAFWFTKDINCSQFCLFCDESLCHHIPPVWIMAGTICVFDSCSMLFFSQL